MSGRKRHVAVDKLGLILVLVVHAANVQDKTGGRGWCCGSWPPAG